MKYVIVLKNSAEGYSVSCPTLFGCHSQGETRSEAVQNIKSAIPEYLLAKCERSQCS